MKYMATTRSDSQAFGVLQRYLDPPNTGLSLEHATALIHELLDPVGPGKPIEYPRGAFGHVVIEVAQQIPHSHPAKDHLARLIQRLTQSTQSSDLEKPQEEYGHNAHASQINHPAQFEPSTSAQAYYVDLSAFLARLTADGVISSPSWAVSTMCETLEENSSENPENYSERISGATVWFLYPAPCLFRTVVQEPPAEDETDSSFSCGLFYTGPTLGMERWRFWQKALVAVEGSRANAECQQLAPKAADVMEPLVQHSLGELVEIHLI
ncbi:hypothetical protein NUU61_002533 [Penicillium alfredii]|uniref:Uncharacterized protein n=1 Tax=Penicillium alfredii TaxID=1506179 RepID=A0A9W9FRP2_9EURO|nr:uncharacterized protein NUU61_002533 [Penicillium alfredii]KAJ5105186.1 hypothetical protein NUU61_002533 [Penicillium alfredii]